MQIHTVADILLYIVFVFSFFGLVFYIFEPTFLLVLVPISFSIATWLTKMIDKYFGTFDRLYLLDIKLAAKWIHWLYILQEYNCKLIIFVYDRLHDIAPERITTEMKQGKEKMIRAIDSGRLYKYVLKIERQDGDEDAEPMALSDALGVAEEKQFTVFHLKARSARRAAEERDRMIEVHSRGKEIVQEIRSGTMDFQLLLSCLVGWDHLGAPDGVCERCGVDHVKNDDCDDDGCLIFDKLIGGKANKGKTGIYKTEIALDHLPEGIRTELAGYVRNLDGGKLGEE